MSSHVLVCDFDADLISRVRERKLVVRVDSASLLFDAVRAAQRNNILLAVWIEGAAPLADLDLSGLETMRSTAIYLKVDGFGSFRDWITQVPILRMLSVLVFVDANVSNGSRDLRILSSLGVPTGIRFCEELPDWESLADLMSYSVYGKVQHAPIQPFQYIIDTFGPAKNMEFGDVFLENPSKFLHVDRNAQVFLSRSELEEGKAGLCGIDSVDEVYAMKPYVERVNSWREFFLKEDGCAYCPVWRLCLGKFERFTGHDQGCRNFFSELLEAAEYHHEKKSQRHMVPFPWVGNPD